MSRLARRVIQLCGLSLCVSAPAYAAQYEAVFSIHVTGESPSSSAGPLTPFDATLQERFLFDVAAMQSVTFLPPLRPATTISTGAVTPTGAVLTQLLLPPSPTYQPISTVNNISLGVEHVFQGLDTETIDFSHREISGFFNPFAPNPVMPASRNFSLQHIRNDLTPDAVLAQATQGYTPTSFLARIRSTVGLADYYSFRGDSTPDLPPNTASAGGFHFAGSATLLALNPIPTSPVPEPESAGLLACGLLAIALARRKAA